jgi:plasmid maintenance system killer protein
LFACFVFLFLLLFRPFGLGTSGNLFIWVSAGYGLCTLQGMLLINMAAYKWFSKYFNEETWTLGKELFWILCNILFIGVINALYSALIGFWAFSLWQLIKLELFTLAVAVFPVTILLLLREAKLKQHYHKQAELLNGKINSFSRAQLHALQSASADAMLHIPSQNAGEHLDIRLDELIYMHSADNYVEVFYHKNGTLQCSLIRNTLKVLASTFAGQTDLLRCHKSYLVNFKKVTHISGNAQGYKLHLIGILELIPVSRQHNKKIREHLYKRP